MKKSLYLEFIEGRLCEKGLLEERYDEEKDELVRKITPKGDKAIKELIKENPIARVIFLKTIKDTLKTLPPELRKDFIKEMVRRLKK